MAVSFKLSKSILSTISPPIPAAYKWIAKTTQDVLDMSQGVPGTAPHPLLQDSLRDTAQRNDAWGYCPAEGEMRLREVLAKEMKATYGMDGKRSPNLQKMDGTRSPDITPSDIAITSGCNLAFVATIMAIADAGDEVILPVPWYFNHQMTLTLLGIKPIPLRTSQSALFLPSPALASSLITPKTRAIALVTPNNPTGAVYPPSLIAEFARLASDRGIALILDETYRDFIVDGKPHDLFSSDRVGLSLGLQPSLPPNLNPGLDWNWNWRSSLVSLYSFSKSYRIPGHRLGAITASPELLREIGKVLDTLQICAPRLPQLALAKGVSVSAPESVLSSSASVFGSTHTPNRIPTPPSTVPSTPGELAEPGFGPIPSPSRASELSVLSMESKKLIKSTEPLKSLDSLETKNESILSALKPDINSTSLAIHARHRLFKDTLEKEAPRWRVVSQGAYYAFVRHPFPNHGSEQVCRKLMEEVAVRVLPGAFFFNALSEDGAGENDNAESAHRKNSDRNHPVKAGHPSHVAIETEYLTSAESNMVEELDRYIRFSVANVSDDKVVQVCQRVGEAEGMFKEVLGWVVEDVDMYGQM